MAGQHRKQPLRAEEDRLRQAIADRREAIKMSQRQLSEVLGWHPMTIGKIERGERSVSVVELIDIAGKLDMNPIDLLKEALKRG